MKTIMIQASKIRILISFAAIVTIAGCKGKAPAGDDASLNAALQNRLQAETGLAGQPVQGSVQDGVATLSGTVTSEAARALAANDAAEVKGLRTVVNNLSVALPSTPSAAVVAPTPAPVAPVSPRRPLNEKVQPVTSAANQAPAPVERRDQYEPRRQEQQGQQPYPQQAPAQPQAPVVRNVTVPSGTGLAVRITQTLDSASTQPGTTFSGALASDVIVDGAVAFPVGTRVTGRVDDAKDAGHFSGNSLLSISLTGISRRGQDIAISTEPFTKEGKGRGKNTAEKIGGGAAVGAILGGIFGGGKGAAIGAGAGGGLGAGANGVTRGEQVQIPSESVVRFRLTNAVTVRESNHSGNDNGSDFRRHDQ